MIKVEITKSGLAAIGKRGFQAVGREAMYAAALYWFKTYLPLHYKNTAYRRYRYKWRDPRYEKIKENKGEWPFGDNPGKSIGEDLPHVFTGRTRELALAHESIVTKAPNFETYRAEVHIKAPVYNFSKGKRIDLRDEVTRFTPQEEKKLEKIFAEAWEKALKKRGLSAPKTTKRIAA